MDNSGPTWLEWLLEVMGADSSRIPERASPPEFMWTSMPESWGVFVLIGIILAIAAFVFFLYARELETCPLPVRVILAGIRFVVIFLLVMIFLGPAVTYTETRVRQPYVIVMRDSSQSMNTRDKYKFTEDGTAQFVASLTGKRVEDIEQDGVSRAEIVNELLRRDDYAFMRRLQDKGKVRVIDFADQVNVVETLPSQLTDDTDAPSDEEADGENSGARAKTNLTPLQPIGRGTDLWLGIKEPLGTNPLAAIVMFTDGQHTAADNRPQEIAPTVQEKGARLLIVGVGDPSRPRNLKVEELYVRPKVWPDEPFEIDAVLRAEGFDGEQLVQLELLEQQIPANGGEPGPPKSVAIREMAIPAGGGRLRETFAHTVTNPGRYVYTARVEPFAGEDPNDNQLVSRDLEVVDEQVKVLLIAGAPSWEYRMVQRLLRRDETISVSCWLQTLDADRPQEGDEPITKLPTSMAELAKYHVVMMFDPNPDEFDAVWIDLLKQFVEKQAGGLFYMAGPKYTGLFLTLPRTRGLKDILPVRFGDAAEVEIARLTTTNRQAWPMRIILESIDHPMMSFYEDTQKSLERWEDLPGIYWSFPTQESKPTTRVLLEHSDTTLPDAPRPLLVSGRYGAGNTVYMGFNGTWRWRRVGRQAEFFDRFWIQATRFLVETRSLQGRRRGYIEPERSRYEIGDKVVLSARLLDATYEPLTLAQVEANVKVGDAEPSPLAFRQIPNQTGNYEATTIARQTGEHQVNIDLAGSAGTDAVIIEPVTFTVETPSAEAKQVWLNRQLLQDIAGAADGKYYGINQLDELSDEIPYAAEEIDIRSKPILLWSLARFPYFLFGTFVVLLTIEWALRKGFKLL